MVYEFEHPETGERKDVFQSMNDEHVYEEDGVKWNRVFSSQICVTGFKVNPFSQDDFYKRTTRGTVGGMMDCAAEMSEMRAEKNGGVDPVKKEYEDTWSKNRKGKKMPKDLKNLEITVKI